MKTLTVLCNVVLFGFTCLVLAVDGAPTELPYIVLTVLMMLIPVFTVFAIVRSGGAASSGVRRVAGICNVVLLIFICWALVEQYPHPEEDGVVAYTLLAVLTPILSMAVLLLGGRSASRRAQQLGAASEKT